MKQFVILLCLCFSTFSAIGQIAYLKSSVDSVLIGETFEVRLEFSGFPQELIEFVEWDSLNNLEHISVIDSQRYGVDFDMSFGNFKGEDYNYTLEEIQWTVDSTSQPITFGNTFKMTVWEFCILGIPGPIITLTNGQTQQLSPVYILIKDPLMQEVEGLSPSAGIVHETMTFIDLLKEYWMLVLGILVALVLIPIAIWWSRRKPVEKVEEVEEIIIPPAPIIPPHIIAMEKLEKLKNSRMWENGEDKVFVSRLTDIIREYIENRFGVQALEMTTQEITETLRQEWVNGKQMDQLKQTLNVSDMIKFAKAKADSNLYERFVDDAIELVNTTKGNTIVDSDVEMEDNIQKTVDKSEEE